jgi:methyltransferase
MMLAVFVLGFVSLQRLGELILSRRNTARQLARGAYEVGAGHYPAMVLLHAAWLAALWFWGWSQPVSLALLGLFAVMQVLRIWVIATLGDRWTTRIIVLPAAPLVAKGPFRWLRHPNYTVVTIEIALLPLALGLPWLAGVFTLLNAAMLVTRISAENAALAQCLPAPSPHKQML